MRLQITKNWFEIYSEKALLLAGTIFFIAGSLLGYVFNARYDGVFDVHFADRLTLYRPFLDNLINTFSLFTALYAAGRIINKNTRMVDILSTSLISRCVFYVIPVFNINGYLQRITETLLSGLESSRALANPLANVPVADIMVLFLFSILSIGLLVLFVVVAYRGFKTATNAKTVMHKVYFALAIVAAEVLSKIILSIV